MNLYDVKRNNKIIYIHHKSIEKVVVEEEAIDIPTKERILTIFVSFLNSQKL